MSLENELARVIDGAPDLSREDVEDVTAVLILLSGAPVDDPRELAVLAAFGERAGVNGDTPEQLGDRVAAYFEGRSSLAFVSALVQLVREDAAHGAGDARAVGAVIGKVAGASGVLGGGTRPDGTVPAGPAARFAAAEKLPRKR